MQRGEKNQLVLTERQRAAVTARKGPVLVLAGPGSGKTLCLIERIRYAICELGIDPARICAFTFTNRAAEEITHRLAEALHAEAGRVRTGTIHGFCAEVLREFPGEAGVQRGFGIADEDYQHGVLSRLKEPARWHGSMLKSFVRFRFRDVPLRPHQERVYREYLEHLGRKNVVDFDQLVLAAADLMTNSPATAASLRSRWDFVLVDEFQDLNRAQYQVVKGLAATHRNVFCVGDDEQAIYSWTGADTRQFVMFQQDFDPAFRVELDENRRSPRSVMEYARRLIARNVPLFEKAPIATRESSHPVVARSFNDDTDESDWIVEDIRADREASGCSWGDYGILYRKHEIGDLLEARMLTAGLPCRLAHGRALSEDPVVRHVIAALRVIASPTDEVYRGDFFRVVLPKALVKTVETRAADSGAPFLTELRKHARALRSNHEDARKIRRGFSAMKNLGAVGRQHTSLVALVEDLLSQRVGEYRTVLERNHEDISPVASHVAVVKLAEQLRQARDGFRQIWLPPMRGAEIALKHLLQEAGEYRADIAPSPPAGAVIIDADMGGELGLPLAMFKALQLLATESFIDVFRDFTVVDLETTGKDAATAQIVEVAAVRVRDGIQVDSFTSLVKPRVPITPGATQTHGIAEWDVAKSPYFEEIWPELDAFLGTDVLVAHNGYQFDFPILRRMSEPFSGGRTLVTYDTLPLARELTPGSRKLSDLAHAHGIDPGESHRALDDCRTLAQVFLRLNAEKIERARKTALSNLLDHLAIAMWLADVPGASGEPTAFRGWIRTQPFLVFSEALTRYRETRESAGVTTAPTVSGVIDALGGTEAMERTRARRTAAQRYPAAMARLRRLIESTPDGTLDSRIGAFLERVVLSRWDGTDADANRVNLLTLHATKGLQFSRVYIVGAEDAELPGLPGARPIPEAEMEEARRLLYVGMTRTVDRLVLTRVARRRDRETGGHRFLDEMQLAPDT